MSSTVKRTVSDDYELHYHSTIQPRSSTVNRSGRMSGGGFHTGSYGGRMMKIVTEMGSSSVSISPELSAKAAQSFLEATTREKKEMQALNDRLGNYIGRVKRLEETNRQLVHDLEELRGHWGKDTFHIKGRYADNLSDARKTINSTVRVEGSFTYHNHEN